MVACLFRFVLALLCFPLLGAYGLRWTGRSLTDMADLVGYGNGLVVSLLDYFGAVLGLVCGVVFALALIPSVCQRRDAALQATGDILLLGLAALFLADVVIPPLTEGSGVAAALPPVSLVVWLATGAAALRLAGFRRRQQHRPAVRQPGTETQGAEGSR